MAVNGLSLIEGGPHGGGMYDGKDEKHNDFPHTAYWSELAKEWLLRQDF